MLQGRRFVRVLPGVWRHRDLVLTHSVRLQAARLALPSSAMVTGITRIQEAGLDFGPRLPLHFVCEGDLHLDLPQTFLHRTVAMPDHDEAGVVPPAAFVAYCAQASWLEAVKVGDWLLAMDLMSLDGLHELVRAQPWRRGAAEAGFVSTWLDGRSRSLPESELRLLVRAAGLPEPEVNPPVELDGVVITPDLWWRLFITAAEYEGGQHQEERSQYLSDIDRYRLYRKASVRYVLVTKEKLRTRRAVVREIHDELRSGGYAGPAPRFDGDFTLLDSPLTSLVGRSRTTSGRWPAASGA